MIDHRFDSFFYGSESEAYRLFGAHKSEKGVRIRTWVDSAYKVAVVGSFSDWWPIDMIKIDERGIWEVEIEGIGLDHLYRIRVYLDAFTYHDKVDPYAFYSELRPNNASIMWDIDRYEWRDGDYMSKRRFSYQDPLNIYEVHLNAFKREKEKKLDDYEHLKETLIPYAQKHGFTHLELMPIFEHPFDGSWGYQASGFFATTARYGDPDGFKGFIDACHEAGIGVILDVVYVHFVPDMWALQDYAFHPMYEYREEHLRTSEWGTFYFDLTSGPVRSFLKSSADFFLSYYHIDGLRYDAVSHFIYHKGNRDLGENVAGLSFIKDMNAALKARHPDAMLIAEDSTDYPKVTVETKWGGLGFDYKWDLGWMNDTLRYYKMDHEYRKYHHDLITFSMAYFYNEKFLLPLSHDEVVHSKLTIVDKMFGTYEEKFRLCRNLFVYMFTHPGKKLNFMGNEIAQIREFDEDEPMDQFLLKYPLHDSFHRFFRDMSLIYREHPCLYHDDYDWRWFKWIDVDNAAQSIFSYYRYDEKECLVVVLNMMPISYQGYDVGVPYSGRYTEIMNSEKDIYSGCNMCNFKPVLAKKEPKHGYDHSITIDIAPFAGIIFRTPVNKAKEKAAKAKD